MKELALIALLGGSELDCGDIMFAKDSLFFVDTFCHMTTHENGVCHVIDTPDDQDYQIKMSLIERGKKMDVLLNGEPVGTCG